MTTMVLIRIFWNTAKSFLTLLSKTGRVGLLVALYAVIVLAFKTMGFIAWTATLPFLGIKIALFCAALLATYIYARA